MLHVDYVQTQQVSIHEILQESEQEPAGRVDQGDEAQEVERVVAVVPGTGPDLPQGEAPQQLPQVGRNHVDGQAMVKRVTAPHAVQKYMLHE